MCTLSLKYIHFNVSCYQVDGNNLTFVNVLS